MVCLCAYALLICFIFIFVCNLCLWSTIYDITLVVFLFLIIFLKQFYQISVFHYSSAVHRSCVCIAGNSCPGPLWIWPPIKQTCLEGTLDYINSVTTNAKHAEPKRANVKLRKFLLLSFVCRVIVMGALTSVTENCHLTECMGARPMNSSYISVCMSIVYFLNRILLYSFCKYAVYMHSMQTE